MSSNQPLTFSSVRIKILMFKYDMFCIVRSRDVILFFRLGNKVDLYHVLMIHLLSTYVCQIFMYLDEVYCPLVYCDCIRIMVSSF